VPVPLPPRPKNNFTIIYAGTFGSFNDLDNVLTAAGILQKKCAAMPVQFRLIGNGPEKERLRKRVLEEQLTTVGVEASVPKSGIYQVLQEADAFLASGLPSPMLRFGICFQKAFDYMASARPTIITTNEERNPISEAQAGIRVKPGDPEELAAGIMQLMTMPLEERLAMGARGRAAIEHTHSVVGVTNGLEQLLAKS
jgi:glycosyltransferase involved in cell wall biosynthesis